MKIKPPSITPSTLVPPAATPTSKADVKNKVETVAHELAGLVGGNEDVKKKDRKKALSELSEKEKRKRLKGLGAKCGIKDGDSLAQATRKIVQGVLSDHYDPGEEGFGRMIDEISGAILQDAAMEELLDRSIRIIQSQGE